jgi:hypothetical protein
MPKTVGDLIKKLEKVDRNAPIRILYWNAPRGENILNVCCVSTLENQIYDGQSRKEFEIYDPKTVFIEAD